MRGVGIANHRASDRKASRMASEIAEFSKFISYPVIVEVVFVVSCFCGCDGSERDHQIAVKALEARGAHVVQHRVSCFVEFNGMRGFSDSDLSDLQVHLDALQKISAIGLYETNITDTALGIVSRYETIRVLNLSRTQVSGENLATLGDIRDLEEIELNDAPRLENIDGLVLCASLARLSLDGIDFSKFTGRPFSYLDQLKDLSLNRSVLTRRDFESLAELPSLRSVSLNDAKYEMKDLEVLKKSSIKILTVPAVAQDKMDPDKEAKLVAEKFAKELLVEKDAVEAAKFINVPFVEIIQAKEDKLTVIQKFADVEKRIQTVVKDHEMLGIRAKVSIDQVEHVTPENISVLKKIPKEVFNEKTDRIIGIELSQEGGFSFDLLTLVSWHKDQPKVIGYGLYFSR